MSRINVILAAALLAQSGIAVTVLALSSDPSAGKPSKWLEGFAADAVTAITVTDAAGTKNDSGAPKSVHVRKSADGWHLASLPGEGYPAQEGSVSGFLGKLARLTTRGAVTLSASRHDQLRVAADAYDRKVEIQRNDGEPLTLYLGSSTGARKVYVRKDGNDETHLVELSRWDASPEVKDWIDASYTDFDVDRVRQIRIRNQSGEYLFDRASASDSWSWVGGHIPAGKKLDIAKVDSLARNAARLRMQAPLAKVAQPEHGLETPQTVVQLVVAPVAKPGPAPEDTDPSEVVAPKPSEQATPEKPGSDKAVPMTFEAIEVGNLLHDDSYAVKAASKDWIVSVPKWSLQSLVELDADDLATDS